jgi:uncharacterized protein (DUF1778 family)
MATALVSKECRLNLRTTKQKREVIESAASVSGQNLTEFVVTSAYTRAEQVLADQRHFELSPEKWNAFTAALDRATNPPARLASLMSEPSILER